MGNGESYMPVTHVSNAYPRNIYAKVEVDRVYLQRVHAEVSVEVENQKGSATGDAEWKLIEKVATAKGFTKIMPRQFLPFKPQTTEQNVYISIFTVDEYGNKEDIAVAHPLLLNDSVIVSAEGQMLQGRKGDLWIDANHKNHKKW